jgi:SAM-dependent methyltransferase
MAFEELKQKHSVMWGQGPYDRISQELAIGHDHLLREMPPADGERWADLATGTGQLALRAARGGANVTGLDLAPALIETAKQMAADEGLQIDYVVGDAEALPFDDASFDSVSSSCGVMFAPDHEAVASELARVTKPGGRLGLMNWHPTIGVPEFFKVMAAYMPPRPEGVGNPFEWGDRDHVTDLLGESFDLRFEEGDAPQPGESGEDVWELFSTSYGPTKTLADSLDDEKRESLRRDWVEFFEQFREGDRISQPRPYVLVLGTRKA